MKTATPATIHGLKEDVRVARESREGAKREAVIATLARSRGSDVDEKVLNKVLTSQTSRRPFARRKRVKFATTGSPSTLDTSIEVNPRPRTGALADATQQTEDDGILEITRIALEFDGDSLAPATIKSLRNQFAVKIHYEGDKKTRTVPLADVMEAGNLVTPNAGVDNATNPDEGVVAGTQTGVRPPQRLLTLEGDETMMVTPGESAAKIELVRLPDYTSDPTLTGETADLYFHATFYGHRVASTHERL